jgi:hypothetical protein
LEASDVKIDATKTNGVAPRHGQIYLSAARQQCAQKQNRCAHPGNQLLLDLTRMEAIRANCEG